MMLSAIKETELEPPLDQQIPILEMVQDSQLEMRALLLHLRPLGLKDKSLGEGIKDLVIDLQKKVPMKVATVAYFKCLKVLKIICSELHRKQFRIHCVIQTVQK